MEQVQNSNFARGGIETISSLFPSAIPRSNPFSPEGKPLPILPSSMPRSCSSSRNRRYSTPSDLYRNQITSPRSYSPILQTEDDSNYVWCSSDHPFLADEIPRPHLSIRSRYLQTSETSSACASTPPSSGLSRPQTPKSSGLNNLSSLNIAGEDLPQTTEIFQSFLITERDENKLFKDSSSGKHEGQSQDLPIGDRDCSSDADVWDDWESSDEAPEGTKVWIDDVQGFEAKVLQAVGYDLKTAASLIPQLYSTLRSEKSTAIGHWETRFRHCSGNDGSSSQKEVPTQNTTEGSSRNNAKKRRSLQDGSEENLGDDQDDNEEDEEQDRKRARNNSTDTLVRFACPFHIWKPDKYNAFHEAYEVGRPKYSACQGPGFSSIARLKDHLQRVHLNVQCVTCAQIFSGKPAGRATALEEHQVAPKRCQLNPLRDLLREGISFSKWAEIEGVIKNMKAQGSRTVKPRTNVDKWMAIWAVLFPKETEPSTPWYETSEPSSDSAIAKVITEFSDCYTNTFEHELSEQLESEKSEDVIMDERTRNFFKDIALKAARLWYTKGAVQGKTPTPLRINSSPNDAQSSQPIADTSRMIETGSTSHGTNKSCFPESRPMPILRQASKVRAASYSEENPAFQSSRHVQPTSHSMSDPLHHLPRAPNSFLSAANFESDSRLNAITTGSLSQDLQPVEMNFMPERTGYNEYQSSTQRNGYVAYDIPSAPLPPESSYGGMSNYSSAFNPNLSNAGARTQFTNNIPQFSNPQYSAVGAYYNYPATQMMAQDTESFTIPTSTRRPDNYRRSNSSSYPNFTQDRIDGLPPWTENTTHGS